MELIEKFGIDVGVLIAQMVNFLVVLLILWKFAYKPILGMLRKRTETIEASLANAEKVQKELAEASEMKTNIVRDAKREASQILSSAIADAENAKRALVEETQAELERLKNETHAELLEKKNALISDARNEIATIVVTATEKIIQQRITPKESYERITESLTHIDSARS